MYPGGNEPRQAVSTRREGDVPYRPAIVVVVIVFALIVTGQSNTFKIVVQVFENFDEAEAEPCISKTNPITKALENGQK